MVFQITDLTQATADLALIAVNHRIEMLPLFRGQLDAPVHNAHAGRLLRVIIAEHLSLLTRDSVANALERLGVTGFDHDAGNVVNVLQHFLGTFLQPIKHSFV